MGFKGSGRSGPFTTKFGPVQRSSAEFFTIGRSGGLRPCQIASKFGKTRARIAEHKSPEESWAPLLALYFITI
jgi:hypothetical protein